MRSYKSVIRILFLGLRTTSGVPGWNVEEGKRRKAWRPEVEVDQERGVPEAGTVGKSVLVEKGEVDESRYNKSIRV